MIQSNLKRYPYLVQSVELTLIFPKNGIITNRLYNQNEKCFVFIILNYIYHSIG